MGVLRGHFKPGAVRKFHQFGHLTGFNCQYRVDVEDIVSSGISVHCLSIWKRVEWHNSVRCTHYTALIEVQPYALLVLGCKCDIGRIKSGHLAVILERLLESDWTNSDRHPAYTPGFVIEGS
jgi:hypothetical protein